VIVVDTSALLAIVLNEPLADACEGVLAAESHVVISAGTLAEALLVAARRGLRAEVEALVGRLGAEVEPVSAASAARLADAHLRWGRGAGTAGLNFGDCFAYEAAKTRGCPLLYVGDDFARTDIESALGPPSA
jgi:ribonuclease VapC